MKTREIRRFPTNLEVREEDDADGMVLEGYAAVFDQEIDFGYFREVIRPGAFADSLRDDKDQVLLHAHNSENVLSSVPGGNMTLEEDDHGLKMRATLNKSSVSEDVYEMVSAGDMRGMSIGFTITEERAVHDEDGKEPTLYELEKVRLYEASTTPFPAYGGTEVEARDQMVSTQTRERRETQPEPRSEPEPEESVPEGLERERAEAEMLRRGINPRSAVDAT